MPIYTLLDVETVVDDTTGTVVTGAGKLASNNEGLVQAEVTVSDATIRIDGRMTDNATWTAVDATAYTAGTDGAIRVALFPQMRARVTDRAGSVTALVNLYTT